MKAELLKARNDARKDMVRRIECLSYLEDMLWFMGYDGIAVDIKNKKEKLQGMLKSV